MKSRAATKTSPLPSFSSVQNLNRKESNETKDGLVVFELQSGINKLKLEPPRISESRRIFRDGYTEPARHKIMNAAGTGPRLRVIACLPEAIPNSCASSCRDFVRVCVQSSFDRF